MNNFKDYIELILKDEGGYVNDPSDSGGETKYGISKRAYPNLNISKLSKEDAIAIYKRDYWNKSKCESLPYNLRYIHLDTSINMWISTAIKLLQKAAKINIDGIIGPQTIEESKKVTLQNYIDERRKKYEEIIKNNPKNIKFKKGWLSRIQRILEFGILNTK